MQSFDLILYRRVQLWNLSAYTRFTPNCKYRFLSRIVSDSWTSDDSFGISNVPLKNRVRKKNYPRQFSNWKDFDLRQYCFYSKWNEKRKKSYINFSKSHYKEKISIGLVWLREKFFRHSFNFLENYYFPIDNKYKLQFLKEFN